MKSMTKRLLAALLAVAALFALAGCSKSDKADAAPKDYTKILHDARPDEDNEYYMIFSPGEDGKFTAQYGYSDSYDAAQLDEEIRNMLLPLLNLEEDMYTDFAASASGMMVQSTASPSSGPPRANNRPYPKPWMPTSRARCRAWSIIWKTSTRLPRHLISPLLPPAR